MLFCSQYRNVALFTAGGVDNVRKPSYHSSILQVRSNIARSRQPIFCSPAFLFPRNISVFKVRGF